MHYPIKPFAASTALKFNSEYSKWERPFLLINCVRVSVELRIQLADAKLWWELSKIDRMIVWEDVAVCFKTLQFIRQLEWNLALRETMFWKDLMFLEMESSAWWLTHRHFKILPQNDIDFPFESSIQHSSRFCSYIWQQLLFTSFIQCNIFNAEQVCKMYCLKYIIFNHYVRKEKRDSLRVALYSHPSYVQSLNHNKHATLLDSCLCAVVGLF